MFNNPFFQVLKIGNFAKIWSSQILSQFTVNVVNFIIVLRIFETTHSTVAVSLVWIFYAIPALLIGPFSGTIVDLTEKRRILMLTTLVESIVILLYLLVKAKIWPIYSVIFLYSLVNQLYIPAEAATLTMVTPRKLLATANSLFLITIYGTFLVGFGLAGSLIRLVGTNTPFLLGSALLFMAFLAVFMLPKEKMRKRKKIKSVIAFFKKVREGYLFIRKDTEILFPLILLVVANVILSIFGVLAPLLATEVLGIDLLDTGLMVIIPTGIGAILGALLVILKMRHNRKKKIITSGLFIITFVLLVLSFVIPRLGAERLAVSIFILFFLGIGLVSIFIPAQTSIQEKTPEEFRGRVFGVLGFLFTLSAIIPVLLAATLADTIGFTRVIFVLALVLGVMAFYSLREPYLNLKANL